MPAILNKLNRYWQLPLLVLVLGTGISMWVYYASQHRLEEAEVRLNIEFDVVEGVTSIERSIQANLFYCVSLVGLFDASDRVERSEFRVFSNRLMAFYSKNSLQALEWIPVLEDKNRAKFENGVATEGYANFQLIEKTPAGAATPAARRDVYYPVAYVEPWKGNEKALGFDLGSNSQRLSALSRARDSGEMVATAPIVLIQERARQHGFLIFAPVYRGEQAPVDMHERRERIRGFALGVYRTGDLLDAALGRVSVMRNFAISVHDVTDGGDDEIYNNDRVTTARIQSKWSRSHEITIAGRRWRVDLVPTAAYISEKDSFLPLIILLSGLLITLALACAFWHQLRRRQDAEQFRISSEHILAEQSILIAKLNNAQNQMLQSEKMASIGQLAAGVAHEINNPIGFVKTNLGVLKHYFVHLLALVTQYKQYETELSEPHRKVLESARTDMDMDYLVNDVPSLLVECEDGILRVTNIVKALKDFSHPGSDGWSWADVEAGLESTLNVVASELKYKVRVVRNYGKIPQIECMPSQLNQVFLNLLVNAAHSISEQGQVTVSTGTTESGVVIEIADTGSGISKENMSKIFLPFFTTKAVGQGTGLGLSLSYSIIQKHHGRIEVSSELGLGTCFRIYLPVQQTAF